MGEWKPKRREVRWEGSIHYSSPSSYELLASLLCARNPRELQKWTSHINIPPDVLSSKELIYNSDCPTPWRPPSERRPESSNKLRNWIFILFILGLSSTFVFEVIVDLWKCLNPSLFSSFSSSSAEIEFQEVKRTALLYGTLWERNYKYGRRRCFAKKYFGL